MTLFLRNRQPQLSEIMDQKEVDVQQLENTYRQFKVINLLLSRWNSIYKREIRPLLSRGKENTLLDIGFGGGDVPLHLSQLAKNDGYNLKITAIEIDERAFRFTQNLEKPDDVLFRLSSSTDLVKKNQQFDFVISNHVLHHLNPEQFHQIMKEAKLLAKKKVIFNDIERSFTGYVLFNLFSRIIFSNSFITADGVISIKRSYRKKELKEEAPPEWLVKRKFPYRLLLVYEKNA